MPYPTADVVAALTADGWTPTDQEGYHLWHREGLPQLLTVDVEGETRLFWAIDRFPLDRIAAGRLPRL